MIRMQDFGKMCKWLRTEKKNLNKLIRSKNKTRSVISHWSHLLRTWSQNTKKGYLSCLYSTTDKPGNHMR